MSLNSFPATQKYTALAVSAVIFLPFSSRDQKQVVALPSLNSPQQSEGDGWCRANLQNTHFSGLTRKNPAFERSVLMYVSIKNRILTQSGQKRRGCVKRLQALPAPPSSPAISSSLSLPCTLAFCLSLPFPRHPPSKAGCGVAFLKLAAAERRRWLVSCEFAKYAFFWPDKEKSCF